MSKALKIFLKISGALILVVLLAAILLPMIYKDKITEAVKQEINASVEGEVRFNDVSLSLLRSFPNLNFGLHDLTVTGRHIDSIEQKDLLSGEKLSLVIDLMSVINKSKPIRIKEIVFKKPNLNLIVGSDGSSNYDIAKSTPDQDVKTEEYDILVDIDRYMFNNATVRYNDASSGVNLEVNDLDHVGKLKYRNNLLDLNLDLKSDDFTFEFGNIPYLSSADLDLVTNLNIDLDANKYTFAENTIVLNALGLALDGFLELREEGQFFDLELKAPGNAFKDFLSLLPNAYSDQFASVKASGDLAFIAKLEGLYGSDSESFPNYTVDLDIQNGAFKYPGKELDAKDINLKAFIENGPAGFEPSNVRIPFLNANLAGNPIHARIIVEDVIKAPKVNGEIKGDLDLEKLYSLYPFPGIKAMRGQIKPDIKTAFSVSQIQAGNYENIIADGTIIASDCHITMEDEIQYQVRNVNATFNNTAMNIASFDGGIGESTAKGKARIDGLHGLLNPDVRMYVSGEVQSDLNLADISKVYTSEDIQKLEGKIVSDLRVNTFLTDVKSGKYEDLKIDGNLAAENCIVRMKDQPEMHLKTGTAVFNNDRVNFTSFDAAYGESSFQGDMTMSNLNAFMDQRKRLGLKGNVRSDIFDVNQFMDSAESTDSASATSAQESAPPELLNRIDLDVNAVANTLIYDTYEIADLNADVSGTLDKMQIRNGKGNINGSAVQLSGEISDLLAYTYENGTLRGNLNADLDVLYVERWMEQESAEDSGSSDSESTDSISYVQIPENIDIRMSFSSDKMYYGDIDITNAKGGLVLGDRVVEVRNFNANGLGGNLVLQGMYDSSDPAKPGFKFSYDLAQLAFGKVFQQVVSFQQIAPIAEFMSGVFNSTLTMEGKLGKDYAPDLKTISAKGLVEILNASFENCPLLNKADNVLDFEALKKMSLEKSKNKFNIKNGLVELEPFPVNIGDIEMNIGGRHKIFGDMEYTFDMKIPKEMLTKNVAGEALNKGFSSIQDALNAKGLKVQDVDFVNAELAMTGKLNNPEIKLKLKSTESGGVSDVVEEKVEDVKKTIKDTLEAEKDKVVEEVKDTLTKTVENIIDSTESELKKKVDETKDKVTDESIKVIESKLDSTVTDSIKVKLDDLLKGKKKKTLDSTTTPDLGKTIKDLNPFKKKKKENE